MANAEFLSCEDEVCRSTNSSANQKRRRNSADTTNDNILEAPRIRTRAASIDNKKAVEKEDIEDSKEEKSDGARMEV